MVTFQKEQAVGCWLDIFRGLSIDIREDGKHGPCPLCGRDGTRGMRFIDTDGSGFCICSCCQEKGLDGWGVVKAKFDVDFVGAIELVSELYMSAGSLKRVEPKEVKVKTKEELLRMFGKGTRYKTGDMIDGYFKGRGLAARPDQHVWLCPQWHKETKKDHPAICSLLHMPDGQVGSYHRTYLDGHGGKLSGVDKKKMMSPKIVKSTAGGCVRLMDLGETTILCLGEGIETALAMSEIFEQPAWATTTAVMLKKWVPPKAVLDQVDHFIIGIDRDRSFTGQADSFALARRLVLDYKKTVNLAMPDKPGFDMADVVNGICGYIFM